MALFGLDLWQWLLPILIGVVSGLVTNAVAIWMLFHPYRPVRWGPVQLLPQGAIPKEIARIARRIGETVAQELLTSEDLGRALASPAFRAQFDQALREGLDRLLTRELGPLRPWVPPAHEAEVEAALTNVLRKVAEGIRVYLRGPWVRRHLGQLADAATSDLADRPLGDLLTPALRADLRAGAARLWAGLRASPELHRLVQGAVARGLAAWAESERPLRHYVPATAVRVGEALVARAVPWALERLSVWLARPTTRQRLEEWLRRASDDVLAAQRPWRRWLGRAFLSDRAVARAAAALERSGLDELAAALHDPELQGDLARAIDTAVERALDRPVREWMAAWPPERRAQWESSLAERIVAGLHHPEVEAVLLGVLERGLDSLAALRLRDVAVLLGPEQARELAHRSVAWLADALASPRVGDRVEKLLVAQAPALLDVPLGRPIDYLPPDAVARAEALLADPLWAVVQRRVPAMVARVPIAELVERKLLDYPLSKVEALIWRVSGKELVLIVYLGGFLGAIVGAAMLFTVSWPAALVTLAAFLLASLVFVNVKG